MPSQTGKVMVVTGGDMGIGKATATALAGAGATVIITARPPGDGRRARDEIAATTGNNDVHVVPLELASLGAVQEAAARILAWPRLDVLVNNAGGVVTIRKKTAEGREFTFGVNYLGPFLLTTLLLDRLAESAPSRVVNVASSQHRAAGPLDFEDVDMTDEFDGVRAYNRSKLAMVLFTRELARRCRDRGVSAFAIQPGAVRSNFGRHSETGGWAGVTLRLLRPFMIAPEKGAGASIYCATEPGLEERSGCYFQRGMQGNLGTVREVDPSRHALDDAAAVRLWDLSERMVGETAAS